MLRMIHLIVWKTFTLLPNKAAEEGHRDEAEGDDEEHCATNHTLRLWAEGDKRDWDKWDDTESGSNGKMFNLCYRTPQLYKAIQ